MTAAAGDHALNIRNLTKSFGSVHVLKDISLAMDPGEFMVLLGPSGCGKSTLLNCIAGLETITRGEILIGERNVTEVPPKDRDVAMVFQSYALYPTMTVGENITFGMRVRGAPKAERDRRLAEVADILQIKALVDRKPAELSGGQRQRVAMGRALVRDPKLFLFDEPLSNLDAKLRVEMRAEIRRLHHTVDASIVYVTHDQIEAMTLATTIVVMKEGIIQQVGTPDEIYDAPANVFVAGFMGSPPMNLIPATVEQRDGGSALAFEAGGAPVKLAFRSPLPRDTLPGGKRVIFGIRPEAIGIGGERPAALDGDLVVSSTEKTGADLFVISRLGGAPMTARLPVESRIGEGDKIRLSIDTAKAACFDPADGKLLHRFA